MISRASIGPIYPPTPVRGVPRLQVTVPRGDRKRRFPLGDRSHQHELRCTLRPVGDLPLDLRRHHDADGFAVGPDQRRHWCAAGGRGLVEPRADVDGDDQIGRDLARRLEPQHRAEAAVGEPPTVER